MKLKNKQCELGHWMEPRVINHCSPWDTPNIHLWWECDRCETKKAMEQLAKWADDRAKKVIQKSDTKVTK
jgi:hypothetical protein